MLRFVTLIVLIGTMHIPQASTADFETAAGNQSMTIRINTFVANEGQGEKLQQLLTDALSIIESADGYVSHQIVRGVDKPDTVVVLETWRDKEAHMAAAQNIPRESFGEVMTLLAQPPSGEYFQ